MYICQMKYLSIFFVLLIYSCANIVMPTGGAKDGQPPVVESSYPLDKSTNFKGNEISLKFNEFVELELPQKNIFISPYTNQIPEFYLQGKKLFVHFPIGLKPNTTYSIQFNRAVKDFTEGNIMQEHALNFSTGSVLDSGKYSTTAISIKDKKLNDMTIVALVKNKFDFFNKNYSYVSKVNNGVASFSNLNKDEYLIYAFVDSNQNLKWDKEEAIAFSTKKAKQGKTADKLILFSNTDTVTLLIATQKSPNEYDVYSPQEIMTIESADQNRNIYQLSPHLFKLICKNVIEGELLKLIINNKSQELKLSRIESNKKIEIIDNQNHRGFDLKRNDSMFINFNAFISKLDTSKIKLKLAEKDVAYKIGYSKNQLILTGLDFKQSYSLELDSMAIWSLGNYNKKTSFGFTTFPKENLYTDLTIKLDTSIINRKTVLFYSLNGVLSQIKINKEIKLTNTFGTELQFHIIIDENKNGVWDTGDVKNEIQPEQYYIETIKLDPTKKEYTLKITNP
jgi:hypothetical protein